MISKTKRNNSVVAFYLPNLCHGGAEHVAVTLAREFAANGISVYFLLQEARGELIAEARTFSRVIDLEATSTKASIIPIIKSVRTYGITHLVSFLTHQNMLAAAIAMLGLLKCKIYLTEHSAIEHWQDLFGRKHKLFLYAARFLFRFADNLIFVSHGISRDFAQRGFHRIPSTIIHNPLNKAKKSKTFEASKDNSVPTELKNKTILFVGRLTFVKRVDLLLHALAKIIPEFPSARLLIVGDGPEAQNLKTLARELALENYVSFEGFQIDTRWYYSTSDVLALTSDHEGLSNVLIEALSVGIRIVSTNCPHGPSEVLLDGKLGTLVEPGNVDAISEAILKSLRDNDMTSKTSLFQKQKARALDFESSRIAVRYLQTLGIPI
ncbi:glycosyltransferase [Cupriavidus sp. IDO]|uniref:glycosyltransferase n=1 Tax=Cupriavidus sp. IDO TaxID=1539142 RepID=UPI0005799E4F|nr:glycosyltransferase [Cupriavidus sp. IDO]KWR90408.1 hypothetical protein RM96_09260 [Cupriavidus sp. IDO]